VSTEGIVVAAGGAGLVMLGLFGIRRLRRPLDPHPRIGLIEVATLSLDQNPQPLPEQPWERKLDRLYCWIGVMAGAGLLIIGLNF
jgi:hypothetical protein